MNLNHPAQIIDRFCGAGKTSEMINNLSRTETYLIVVPYLSEVTRVIEGAKAKGIEMYEPEEAPEVFRDNLGKERTRYSKLRGLLNLASEKKNIVTTHALYPSLNTAAMQDVFKDYTVIIDEVVETVKALDQGLSSGSFEHIYLRDGYVKVDQATGQVWPTPKWDACFEAVKDNLSLEAYHAAKAGTLYSHDNKTLVWALPKQLLTAGSSLQVYTYLSEGSLMAAYLKRVGIPFKIDKDPEVNREYLKKAKALLTVKLMKNLTDLRFSFNGQKKMSPKDAKKVAKQLHNLAYRELKDIHREDIIVTCAKDSWFEGGRSWDDLEGTGKKPRPVKFSKGSGLFAVNWLPNTTRGSNRWSHCSHVIYLHDQFASPEVQHWLGMDGEWLDRYALTEAVQLIWRSRIRKGEPTTVYFASQRMHDVFMEWLNQDLDGDLLETFLDGANEAA